MDATYCKQIPNSNSFVYLRERDFRITNLNTKPFFHMTDGNNKGMPLTQQQLRQDWRGVILCWVGDRKCVLKIVKCRDGISSSASVSERFTGLIASMFCVGPSVLDMWCVPAGNDEDGRMEYYNYFLMEFVDMTLRNFMASLESYAEKSRAENTAADLMDRMLEYIQLHHHDNHTANTAVYRNGRLCILDWEGVPVVNGPRGMTPIVDDEYKKTSSQAKLDMQARHTTEAELRSRMPMHKEPHRLIDARNKTSKPIDNPKDYGLMDAEMLE
jgi:hypothetical protein